jgi:hypothetical protein
MSMFRINLRPDMRPPTGWRRSGEPVACGHGKTPMLYGQELIGHSHAPIYAAARWLLDNGVAQPGDTVGTFRDGRLCMSGEACELAKRTVIEDDDGNPTFQLRGYKPFPTTTVRSRTPVEPSDAAL